ncbi:MAG: hypothetical protein R2754_17340 [Microthrixaceae bacterium]
MDPFSPTEFDKLAAAGDGPFVSIQLPTHEVGPGPTTQDTVTYRQLVHRAQEGLERLGWRRTKAEELLSPAARLEHDSSFWSHQSRSLAVFVAPGLFRTQRMDRVAAPLSHVSEHGFHLKELIPLTLDRRFLVLAISRKQLRLVEADPTGARMVELGDVPASLADALWFEDPEKQLQHHQAGGPSAVFHGHGAERDDKEQVRRFIQRIDGGLTEVLKGLDAPLVLAGVAYEVDIVRNELSYGRVVDGSLDGNFDTARPGDMAAQATPLVQLTWEEPLRRDLERFGAMQAAGTAVTAPIEVVQRAREGRVEVLVVASGLPVWAAGDQPDSVHDEFHPGDEDLTNTAALAVRATGGTVHVVAPNQVPDGGPVAAILRY